MEAERGPRGEHPRLPSSALAWVRGRVSNLDSGSHPLCLPPSSPVCSPLHSLFHSLLHDFLNFPICFLKTQLPSGPQFTCASQPFPFASQPSHFTFKPGATSPLYMVLRASSVEIPFLLWAKVNE